MSLNKTPIEWVKNPDGTQGYTWNPITGCLNGCEYCYARKLANTRLRERYLANNNIANADVPFYEYKEGPKIKHIDPFYPRFWPERLDELDISKQKYCQFREGHGIFVCDMSDLFGMSIPEEWTRRVLEIIKMNWHHRFYLLTKQPQNLIKWSPFPDNCRVGVSVTNKEQMKHLWHLCYIQAGKRFISFEPLLEDIYTGGYCVTIPWAGGSERGGRDSSPVMDFIDLVIIGAQTCKSYWELCAMYPNDTDRIMKYGRLWTFQPRIEWVQEIVEACDKAGIPVFLKDNLRQIIPFTEANSGLFESIPGIPTGIKLRQEMPANKLSENQGVVYL